MDDIIVIGKLERKHLENLEKVFEVCRERNLASAKRLIFHQLLNIHNIFMSNKGRHETQMLVAIAEST